MTKIMLVEDDNNLREIYEARLSAEGYDIVSAHDGEVALAMAAKERPDLVITDVMMPKISGFEMLDILRNTANLRDVKVIMLTALGQAEDNARANALGADRYLVKSQVTLEDIVKAAHEVLEDSSTPGDTDEAAASNHPDSDVRTWQSATPETAPPTTPAVEPEAARIDVVQPTEPSQATQLDLPNVPTTPDAEDVPHTNSYLVGGSDAAAPIVAQAAQNDTAANPADTPVTSDDTTTTDDEVSETPVEPAVESNATSEDNTVADDHTNPEIVKNPEPEVADQLTAEHLTPEEAANQSEIAAAEPAAQEESDIREQIEEFLDDNTQPEIAKSSDGPTELPVVSEQPAVAEQSTVADQPADEYEKDDNTPDMGRLSVHGEAPPADEDESEYEKDAATPDMGQMEVHEEVIPDNQTQPLTDNVSSYPPEPDVATVVDAAPVESAPTTDSTPGYPSQPYELPVMPGGALSAPVEPQQSSGDKVVSDAINDMIASTAPASHQPGVSASQPEEPPIGVTPSPVSAPSQPASGSPNDINDTSDGISHRRIISPIGTSIRPDINQLLAMEDAKAAAIQAGTNQQPSPAAGTQPPQPQDGQGWQPLPVQEQPRRDVYGPGIDPNSISL